MAVPIAAIASQRGWIIRPSPEPKVREIDTLRYLVTAEVEENGGTGVVTFLDFPVEAFYG